MQFERRYRSGSLGRLVAVASGDVDGDGVAEIAVAAGKELKLFDAQGGTFVLAWQEVLPHECLSVTVGQLVQDTPAVVVGMRDGIVAFHGFGRGDVERWETLSYPNAFFRTLSVGDVDRDGRDELLAAASGAQTLYMFRVLGAPGERRLEEFGRVYIGGLVEANVSPGTGEVAAATRNGYLDVFVPCSLLPTAEEKLVTVKRGDSIWRLARRYQTSVDDIARANGLERPYRLEPGQLLLVPRGTRSR